jgi:adipocyte plasma membrane-associated protein
VDNLWVANGVGLSPKEDFVLVNDLMRSKIVKFWLSPGKFGQTETFAEGLPGIPDNIAADKNGLWVAFPLSADPENPLLLQSMAPLPLLRKFVSRILALFDLAFKFVDKIYPNNFCKGALNDLALSTFETTRSTVMRFDWDGKVLAVYHAFDGSSYSHCLEHEGHLYLGSFTQRYIAKVVKRAHL